ncbi:MAG: LacI family DNA-binding transcriptional regulator [Ferruginibacter sp.]
MEVVKSLGINTIIVPVPDTIIAELKMKEVTIYDIASKLNLSPSSVSRALNNITTINHRTRKRVLEVADEMGYRVNNFAQNLRTQKGSKLIGVIIHKLDSQFAINALYSIEKVIRSAGYNMLISHSAACLEQEIINAENFFQRRIEGLIVSLASNTESADHFSKYINNNIPVFLFDSVQINFPGVKVTLDNVDAAYIATTHLIEQGCKRIIHIAGNQSSSIYSDRLRGYKNALIAHDIPFDPQLVLQRGIDAHAVPFLTADILNMSPLPDGVFVVNDMCGVLCMKSLMQAGIGIPEDMAFVGFNNDIVSTIVEPNLTTIQYSGTEIGEIVAEAMMDRLDADTTSAINYTSLLKGELIIRGSSKRNTKNEKATCSKEGNNYSNSDKKMLRNENISIRL